MQAHRQKRKSRNLTREARIWILALAFALFGATGFAQNTNSGEIKGLVTDVTGAVISEATVTVTNIGTGVVLSTTTNASGLYDMPSLLPGQYSVSFSKPGFKSYVRKGLTLQIATIGVNATLGVGSTSQEVVVTAQEPLLQTESSDQNVTFDQKAVQNAPTVGGVWYNELTNTLPGVNGGGSQDASGQGVGVNGTQGYQGNWLLEGSTATQPRDVNASDNYPPIDAIQEVHVNTGGFGAQYGGGVATFNVILKSGANKWHGSAFEFIQNDALNALNYFTPSGKKAPLRWNEFGGSIGGPILRDKLFFYFTYQRNPAHSSFVATTTVPTSAMLGGDFSAFPYTVYDPATTACTGSASSTCTRTAFLNNKIPSTRIDGVAAAIQKYFPAPNQPGLFNNYRVVVTTPSLSQWYAGKVDYQLNANNRLSGSILEYPISLINNIDALCPLGFDCTKSEGNRNQDVQITETAALSASTLNEVRVGLVRELDRYTPPTYGKGYPAKIGLQPAYGSNAPGDIFPNVTINGGAGAGQVGIGGGVHAVLADGAYVASDVVTLIRGRHSVKIGGEFDKSYQNYTSWGDVSSGNFQFNGIATSNFGATDPRSGQASQGVPYADFLLGQVYGWYVYDSAETGARMWNGAGFVQDDFKALPNLTLNIGLRYQYQSGWSEVKNRWGTFDPTLVNTGKYVAPGTLGAITYGGQNGRHSIQDGVNQWAPRLGFSWQPLPKWAVRGVYGIFDVPRSAESYTDGALGLGLNPQGSKGYGSFPAFDLATGPPTGSVIYPSLDNLSNSQFNYQGVNYYPVHMPIEYYQESMLSVQRELPFQMLFDTTYVFTKGTHMNFGRDINQVPEASLSKGSSASPYPQFTSIDGALFDGYSNYHALQFRLNKRTSYGLSFLINYSLSKTMDTGTGSGHAQGVDVWQNAYNVSENYGLSQLDTTNTLNGYATYEVPVGAGRGFALHGVADKVLGGWRVTGVFQVHSGVPFTPTVGSADHSNSGANQCGCGFAWYPNVIGNPSVQNQSISQWFNPAAFATPAASTFGNAHRNMLRGPGWRNLDLSVGKTFHIYESSNLEIRADSFDVLNHPNFGQPSAGVGTGVGGAGVISSANTSRQMQLGGRFTF